MGEEQFAAIMPYICSDLIKMIIEKQNISEKSALSLLYGSKLYALLEREDTKVWQCSTEMLYSLLLTEKEKGIVEFPDT